MGHCMFKDYVACSGYESNCISKLEMALMTVMDLLKKNVVYT